MFVLLREKRTLDEFRRWKVPQLKEFLRSRGLKTSGTKDELSALAFGAEQLCVPVKLTAEEEIIQKKKQYQSLPFVACIRRRAFSVLSLSNSNCSLSI